jgi:iron(III) transport system substrate-binding protein
MKEDKKRLIPVGSLSVFIRVRLWLIFVFLSVLSGCTGRSQPRIVLYCAQDREFAEHILDTFNQRHAEQVVPRFDTEANKSVSLYEDLVREARKPRCDVHWNNEILATIRLQRQGLLEPYASPSAEPFPPSCKAKDHTWTAFAARARILLVNTARVKREDCPKGLLDLTAPRWRGRAAMAKPQFGTSATQAACLFQVLGSEKAEAYYRGLRANDIQIVAGNKQVAEGVGRGQFDVGVTDTDDAAAEVEAGRPVAVIFPDRDGPLGTLFLPNTLAIIRGGPNPNGARLLVDYLLSAEVEEKLARSASKQIPLNPNVNVLLPAGFAAPHTIHTMPVDFERAADLWQEVQTFLTREFAR